MIKEIGNLSDAPAMSEKKDLTRNDLRFTLPRNNFVGNPIYHFRRWWLRIELERNDARKYEAKIMALKILELKTKSRGENVPLNITEQIEYYEGKLASLEKKIAEFEEG